MLKASPTSATTFQTKQASSKLIRWWKLHGSKRTLKAFMDAMRDEGFEVETLRGMDIKELISFLSSNPAVDLMRRLAKRIVAIAKITEEPGIDTINSLLASFKIVLHPEFTLGRSLQSGDHGAKARLIEAANALVGHFIMLQETPDTRSVAAIKTPMEEYLAAFKAYRPYSNERMTRRLVEALYNVQSAQIEARIAGDTRLLDQIDSVTLKIRAKLDQLAPGVVEHISQTLQHPAFPAASCRK
jgi:hypothetical protein